LSALLRIAIALAMIGTVSAGAAAKKRHVTHMAVETRTAVIAYGFQEPQKTYTLRYNGGPKSPMRAAPAQ
jgi:hypothetical protein